MKPIISKTMATEKERIKRILKDLFKKSIDSGCVHIVVSSNQASMKPFILITIITKKDQKRSVKKILACKCSLLLIPTYLRSIYSIYVFGTQVWKALESDTVYLQIKLV